MDYQVGSLADMISSTSAKKKKKSRKSESGEGVKIEFQKVERASPVLSNKKQGKKRKSDVTGGSKKKISKIMKLNDGDDLPSLATTVESINSTHAKKRLEMKGLPKPTKKKDITVKVKRELVEEHEARTIFVGNLCNTTTKSDLKKIFRKYGLIDNMRLRGAPVADPRVPKRVAMIRKEFHPDRTNIHAYVRFDTVKSAQKALAVNGQVEKEHTLRVDLSAGANKGDIHNPKKGIFVGNIKFTLEEEDLRKVFETCGKIDNIRLVRDSKTGMGKGFGFVNFEKTESVELALQLDGKELDKRPIRVTRCDGNAKPKKTGLKKKVKAKNGKGTPKFEKNINDGGSIVRQRKAVPDASEFKGQEIVNEKAKKNKKKKQNKSEQKKKVMLNKLEINPMKRVKKQKTTPSP